MDKTTPAADATPKAPRKAATKAAPKAEAAAKDETPKAPTAEAAPRAIVCCRPFLCRTFRGERHSRQIRDRDVFTRDTAAWLWEHHRAHFEPLPDRSSR